MKRGTVILIGLLVLALIGTAGYFGFRSTQPVAVPTPSAPRTVPVTQGDVRQTVSAPGQLVTTRQVDLTLEAGGRLAEVAVRPGDTVTQGQTLARLDEWEEYTAEIARAQVKLDQAKHELEKLQKDVPLQAAEAQLALVEAEDAMSQAQSNRNKLNYSRASKLVVEKAKTDYLLAKRALRKARKAFNKVAHKKLTHPKRVKKLRALINAQKAYYRARAIWKWYLQPPTNKEIAEADAELALAEARHQAALDKLNACPSADDLALVGADLAAAQDSLDRLLAKPSRYEIQMSEIKMARLEVQKVRAHLVQTTDGLSPVDVEQAEEFVHEAETALEKAQANLEAAVLRAPFDGAVLEVNAAPGDRVSAGATLISLMDPTAVEARVTAIEEDLPLIEVGQPVELFVDALPDASLRGHVARIIPQSVPGESPRYPVYISLDGELPAALAPGMTVDASIAIAERQDVLTLPRALVRARSDGTAPVKVWVAGRVEERTVRVGLRGDLRVEIVEGLREGEQVVGE